MRILVCGGRDYDNGPALFRTLDVLRPSLIIEGGARGADHLAAEWARHRSVPVETYRADWNTHGKAAGMIRNGEMLTLERPD